MEKKNAELPLIILIIIVLIIILILGAFIYYFLNTPNFSNSLDNSNISLQNINTTNTEQITNSNSLNEVQNDSINADTNTYSQNISTNSQSSTSNTNVTTYSDTNNTTTSSTVSTPNIVNDFSSYIGVWRSDFVLDSGIPAEELIINNITSNTINFDYIKYRNFSIDNVIAQLTDNIANFEFSKDDLSVKGTITLSNNTVVLTINSSTFEYIKPGVYTFKSKAQNSILK